MRSQTSFLICCLPRSGSWLLAEGLQQTAVAGNPREYFAPESEASWRQRWGLPADAAYGDFVARAIDAGSTSNGVFGAKIHWYQFEHLEARLREAVGAEAIDRGALFERFFPELRLIWLRRRDKVRQAVSYYKASRTQQWWDIGSDSQQGDTDAGDSHAGGDGVQFDFAGIDRLRHTLMTHEGAWGRFFRESAIRPFVVEYEDLARDYEGSLRSVLDHLGIEGSASIATGRTRLRKQADDVSNHWVRQFRQIERQQLEQRAAASASPMRIAVYAPAAGVPIVDSVVAAINSTTCHFARCVWSNDAGSGVTFDGDIGTTESPRAAAAELVAADLVVLCNGYALPQDQQGAANQAVVAIAEGDGRANGELAGGIPVVTVDASVAARLAWLPPVAAPGNHADLDRQLAPVVAGVVAAGVSRTRTRRESVPQRRDRPRLSVIIASHNEGVYLRRTVQSVLAGLAADDEIIIVDDHSTDVSPDCLATADRRVRVLRPDQRQGSARARNFGSAAAQGDVLVFADAHVETPATWADRLLAPIFRAEADAVAPRLNDLRVRGNGVCGGRLEGVEQGLLNWRWLGWRGPGPHPAPLLCGCFLAVGREAFDTIGGFDDGIFPYGLEDTEISLRLWTRGYRCLVVPEVLVTHRFGMPDRRTRSAYKLSESAHMYHVLRLAFIHFGAERLQLFIELRKDLELFPAAFARVLAGDAGERRSANQLLRKYDDEWFFTEINAE